VLCVGSGSAVADLRYYDFLKVCRVEIDGVGVEANERNCVFAKALSTLAPYRRTNVRKSTTIGLCRRLSAVGPLLI
jgi:hypothetical protein